MQYDWMQYNCMQYDWMQYNCMQYDWMQYNCMQYDCMQCNCTILSVTETQLNIPVCQVLIIQSESRNVSWKTSIHFSSPSLLFHFPFLTSFSLPFAEEFSVRIQKDTKGGIEHFYSPLIVSRSLRTLLLTGPEYWELINPSWSLCNKGKRQSPIDIKPEQLLFDPSLESIQVIGNKVWGQNVFFSYSLSLSLSIFFSLSLSLDIFHPLLLSFRGNRRAMW